jgi:hypothetical protein
MNQKAMPTCEPPYTRKCTVAYTIASTAWRYTRTTQTAWKINALFQKWVRSRQDGEWKMSHPVIRYQELGASGRVGGGAADLSGARQVAGGIHRLLM